LPTWNSEGLLSSQVLRFCLPAIGQLAALALEKSMNHLYCDHRRILLIDQNPTKQNLRATILRNYEIEVHTASSVADAASLSRTHAYDLILLAAQEHSEEADALRRQIRAIRPRQRIGLLVGPPTFVLELAGPRKEGTRKKAASVIGISPSRVVNELGLPASTPDDSTPYASSPQWQEMIRKLVTDWYVGSSGLLGLPRVTDRSAGA
jgi:CheY-like chemotaxis protein